MFAGAVEGPAHISYVILVNNNQRKRVSVREGSVSLREVLMSVAPSHLGLSRPPILLVTVNHDDGTSSTIDLLFEGGMSVFKFDTGKEYALSGV